MKTNQPAYTSRPDTRTGEQALDKTTGGRFSGMNMFALYPGLKDKQYGEGAYIKEEYEKKERIRKRITDKLAGFSLVDRQLSGGAWTLFKLTKPGKGLMSWNRIAVTTPEELGVEPYADTTAEMAKTVKKAAKTYGAGAVGISEMNESYINQTEYGVPILIEDVDKPVVTEEKYVIPKKMKWVVSMAVPMDPEMLSQVPGEIGDAAVALGYGHSIFIVSALAEFIRGLGYEAIPSFNDTAQSIPFAIDAGLGELGRTNKLITRDFGAGARLCKVFTDMPLQCDKPVSFGVADTCRSCMACAEACPTKALSFEKEPGCDVKGPWNNPGHLAWYEDSFKCFEYWQKIGNGCGICMTVCPYTRISWKRDSIRQVSSTSG